MPDEAPYLLDVTRLIWRRWRARHPTGIDRVCLAYLRHFGDRAQAVVHHERVRRILSRDASRELFELLESPPATFRSKLVIGAFRNFAKLNSTGKNRIYLNVGHTGLNSPGFRDWVARADVRPIYLVHDLIPITHPQFCRPGEAEKHSERVKTVLATASGVIGNSRSTLDDLSAFASTKHLTMPPSLAAWLGVDPLPIGEVTAGADERPTFVTIGTIEARKNHLLLLQIWSDLIDQLGDRTPRLMIIGQRGWEADNVFEQLDHDLKLKGHVIELNCSSDRELATHLSSARALLFPSFAEGYGLPLIEAFAAHVPVVATDLPALREIGGDIPTYLPPADGEAWKNAILEFTRPHSSAREAQLERLKSFRKPDWDGHFKLVESWLDGFV